MADIVGPVSDYVTPILLLAILLLLRKQGVIHEPHQVRSGRGVVLDSCALIDGRISELAQAGFVPERLVVPEFIIAELQLLADGNDSYKRERARFGLDVIKQLQDLRRVTIVIDRTKFANIKTTDDKLIALSKKLNAQLYTTDFNLAKVAAIEGVQVLNVNDLAQRLRPITLPGEQIQTKIIQKGSGQDQGVGYLEDGTMIVVDRAAKLVGKTITVSVDRMHNTVAGKMIFAHASEAPKKKPLLKQTSK